MTDRRPYLHRLYILPSDRQLILSLLTYHHYNASLRHETAVDVAVPGVVPVAPPVLATVTVAVHTQSLLRHL